MEVSDYGNKKVSSGKFLWLVISGPALRLNYQQDCVLGRAAWFNLD